MELSLCLFPINHLFHMLLEDVLTVHRRSDVFLESHFRTCFKLYSVTYYLLLALFVAEDIGMPGISSGSFVHNSMWITWNTLVYYLYYLILWEYLPFHFHLLESVFLLILLVMGTLFSGSALCCLMRCYPKHFESTDTDSLSHAFFTLCERIDFQGLGCSFIMTVRILHATFGATLSITISHFAQGALGAFCMVVKVLFFALLIVEKRDLLFILDFTDTFFMTILLRKLFDVRSVYEIERLKDWDLFAPGEWRDRRHRALPLLHYAFPYIIK